jgi:GAF domain-containing protein
VSNASTGPRRAAAAPRTAPAADRRFLHEVIRTVSSTLELERVLAAIVDLLSEATGCHACYVFLADEGGRMVLSACSEPYASHVGRAVMEPGEGLAGWVAEHREPVFITEDALSDPRMKAFAELEEDKYQSLVSVPLIAKDGSVLGVVALHAEAPHVYSEEDAQFLLTSASLVAGALENAKLHAETERRVRELERLFRLAATIAEVEGIDELLPAVARRLVPLLDAAACEFYLLEADRQRLRLRASHPPARITRLIGLEDVGIALAARHEDRRATVVAGAGDDAEALHVPLVVAGGLVGLLIARGRPGRRFGEHERDLAATVVAQTAVAVARIQLLERLAERNLVKDFFDDLARGALSPELERRARRLRCDLAAPRVVLWAGGGSGDAEWPAKLEATVSAIFRNATIERGETHLRALLPLAGDEAELRERVRQAHRDAAPLAVVGLSSPCAGAESYTIGFAEARQAMHGARVVRDAPAVVAYEELGSYKYLLRLAAEPGRRDEHRDRLRALLAYDREHRSQLFHTLEEYLRQRGRVAATAANLFVHPNTLRQRLGRIQSITGIDVEHEDALTIEMAAKLLQLEEAISESRLP